MAVDKQNRARPVWPLSIDSIDTHDEDEREALIEQVLEAGNAIALAERDEMIRKGIIDEGGKLLITDLPEDMRKEVDRDFGG
jgi:hypothetical protein